MKLIVGLGNLGARYAQTRHNAGFMAADFYLRDKQPISCASKFAAEICELHVGATKLLFIKPITFMNNSGDAVREIAQFYKVDAVRDLLVLHDEVDLPIGTVRLARNSSHAGHNGIKSIFEQLGTQEIARIRIGVEARASRNDLPTDVFVLQNFTDEELKLLDSEVLPQANTYIDSFVHA